MELEEYRERIEKYLMQEKYINIVIKIWKGIRKC